ncbi:E3 ubiquitin-protein ligase LRSAM1-like isoform X1 [Senna tora]|uniref:E3 ubiquitin-protein ligase LRSAM1-like isoform X1 n=1 Tax=Senna tora TaxID=362788 RepID=A0A834X024_9FABA|nr:E3 ubiquitin-protein ligase LRSAM1-like isoform X1 [Senna tora]
MPIWKLNQGPSVEVASKNSSTAVCHVCYSSSSTRCSRCKAVYYCSGKCQIIHWRQGHKDECVEKKNSRAKKPAAAVAGEGNTNLKPFEISEEATKKDHEQNEERIRFLEEELKKYKNEVEQLKSERDKWEMQTSFVSKRLNSLMREYDEHKIAEDRERRKHDEHIHMLQNECAKLKQELKEERKDVKRLQSQKFVEALMAKRKVKEISEELANACRDVEYATARADNAENKWIMTKRELQEEKELVKLLKMECQETRQSVMRQVEEKELELANALKDVVAAKTCAICLTNEKDMAFGCGHMTCAECGITMSICPICRKQISSRLKLFPG